MGSSKEEVFGQRWQCSAMCWVTADLVGVLRLGVIDESANQCGTGVYRGFLGHAKPAAFQCHFPCLPHPHHAPPYRLGIAFAYYGVILASAELLERDLGCTLRTSPSENAGPVSEESRSPCYCHPFGPSAYRTMIISTAGEIARNLLSPSCAHCKTESPNT